MGEGRIRLSTVTPHLPKILSIPDSQNPSHVTNKRRGPLFIIIIIIIEENRRGKPLRRGTLPGVCRNRSSKKIFAFEFSLPRKKSSRLIGLWHISCFGKPCVQVISLLTRQSVSGALAPIMEWWPHSDLLDAPLRRMQLGIA